MSVTVNRVNVNSLNSEHGDEQFKPNATVAAIIVHQNNFLVVE